METGLEEKTSPGRKKAGPESILWLFVMIAAALLIATLVLCNPFFGQEEDPEELTHSIHAQMEAWGKVEPLEETEPLPEDPVLLPELNPYTKRDFQYDRHNYLYCKRQESYPGIDVSAFQGNIDWTQVRDSGIRFAMIRLGYRGYGQKGTLVEDEYAQINLQGAYQAGLAIGAYFFSQATSIEEVDEEIEFLLNILGDRKLDMPIVLDWEYISDTARTAHVDGRTLTDCLLHFCRVMEEKGYQPMIYFNWHQSTNMLKLCELEEYPFWLALYQDRMTYPYRVEMWQWTCTGRVPGINGDVDINVYMPDLRK